MIKRFITGILNSPDLAQLEGISYWRQRIFYALLGLGLLLGFLAYVPAIIMAVRNGLWGLALFDTLIYLAAITLWRAKHLLFEIRVWAVLLIVYLVGSWVVLSVGLLSGGPAWLFAFAVLAGILVGIKGAVIALVLNALTLFTIGALIFKGHLAAPPAMFTTIGPGITAGFNFIFSNAIAAISVAVLMRGLVVTAVKEKEALENVRLEHNRLRRAKEKLENEVSIRKRAQKALKKSEERYRTIFNSVGDIIYIISRDRKIEAINPAFEKVTDWSNQDWLGKDATPLIHPEDLPRANLELKKFMAEGRSKTVELRIATKSGDYRTIEFMPTPLIEEGRLVSIFGIGRDVTERKLSEERRKEMEKQIDLVRRMESIGTLAGGIAHQFNNALSVISGNIQLLELKNPEDKGLERYFGAMLGAVERMVDLTNQLLAYARSGKYNPQALSISAITRETLAIIANTLRQDVSIETDLCDDVNWVHGDGTQLQMVISALLSNASEALEGGGVIRVHCRNHTLSAEAAAAISDLTPGEYVELVVADNGKGMAADSLKKVFEPFFTTKFQGRGLGLAAVYGIIRNHHGHISIQSEPGKGTRVFVLLPVASDAPPRETAEAVLPMRGEETILLIEDEEAVRDITCELLESLGYRVIEAQDGREALAIANDPQIHIDLAILDIILPDMSGEQVFPLLIQAKPDLKVIVASGYSLDGPAKQILSAGAHEFIQKPFTMAALSQMLKRVLN